MQRNRRLFIQTLAFVTPAALIASRAEAAKNDALRGSLKYQDKPSGTKHCANCMQFVPGKGPKDMGGCKIIPGDTEISPDAFCVAWVEKK